MQVLVTGGAGFIGSHVVDALIKKGNKVVVLDNFSSGKEENLQEAIKTGRVSIIRGTILDKDVIRQATVGCDIVFHLAVECVRRSLGNPLSNHQVNASGTINALEASRRSGVKLFVYCSSSEVYGNASSNLLSEDKTICEPVTVYGAAKLAGELYTKAYFRTYGLKTMIVRPFNAYGPRAHDEGDLAEVIPKFISRVRNDLAPIIFGNPKNGRDFTFVSDIVAGILAASECQAMYGNIVNIAYGKMLTIGDLAATIQKLYQKDNLEPIIIEGRPGDVHVLNADICKAVELFDFKASIKLEDGLVTYFNWLQEKCPNVKNALKASVINWTMPS
jgi:UDP-glucose 4-epimerase